MKVLVKLGLLLTVLVTGLASGISGYAHDTQLLHPTLHNVTRLFPDDQRAMWRQGVWYNCERFFPIGFSKKQRFAYLAVPQPQGDLADETAVIELRILNLVTDEIVERVSFPLEPYRTEITFSRNAATINYIEQLIEKEGSELSKLLVKHEIVALSEPPILFPPTQIEKGVVLDIQFRAFDPNPKDPPRRRKHFVDVVMTRGDQEKTLTRTPLAWNWDSRSDEVVTGYLKSPFEDRAAVFVGGYFYKIEHETYCPFTVMGAHLTRGFSKVSR